MNAFHPRIFVSASFCAIGILTTSLLPSLAQQQLPGVPGTQTSPSLNQLSPVDQNFVRNAAQSDMAEIMTSRLALQRSREPRVRSYAQQMIREHTLSSTRLQKITQTKGISLPKQLSQESQQLLQRLQQVNSANFDQAYLNAQVAAHTRAVNLYQQYLQQGQDPQLTAFANQNYPIISQHLNMAQAMVARR